MEALVEGAVRACMQLQLTRRNFLELEQVIECGYDDTNTGRLQLDRIDADAQRQNHRHRHIDEGNILMATTRISCCWMNKPRSGFRSQSLTGGVGVVVGRIRMLVRRSIGT